MVLRQPDEARAFSRLGPCGITITFDMHLELVRFQSYVTFGARSVRYKYYIRQTFGARSLSGLRPCVKT